MMCNFFECNVKLARICRMAGVLVSAARGMKRAIFDGISMASWVEAPVKMGRCPQSSDSDVRGAHLLGVRLGRLFAVRTGAISLLVKEQLEHRYCAVFLLFSLIPEKFRKPVVVRFAE